MPTPDAPPPINACETYRGTGILDLGDGCTTDCLDCLEECYCPACGADNINVVSVDGDGCTWTWDGTTPCPACGWKLDNAQEEPRDLAVWEVQQITQWQPSAHDIYEGYYAF